MYCTFIDLLPYVILLRLCGCVLAIDANPLPAPQEITWRGNHAIAIDANVGVTVEPSHKAVEDSFHDMIQSVCLLLWKPAAIDTPRKALANADQLKKKWGSVIDTVSITIVDTNAELQLGVDESYRLQTKSNSSSIEIVAQTPYGALHALTTLRQIILYDDKEECFYIELDVQINDWPLFSHRGLMIDSGRNYLTVDSIKEQIDIMSLSKMNVLHWHLVDSQSWPVQLDCYPEMTEDAYSSRQVYTKNDIKSIVSYAKSKAVRVIPEIDWPGHSRAGYLRLNESVLSCENSWWGDTAVEPAPGQLEIVNNATYKIVNQIYQELSEAFEDESFHVGGDEVLTRCYDMSKSTQDWLAANSSRQYKDLLQYWLDHALPLFRTVPNRRLMMWEDIAISPEGAHVVPKDIILQSWGSSLTNVKKLSDQGYDLVVSSSSHLYLDCGYGGWLTGDPRYVDDPSNDDFNKGQAGSWCGPYKTWQRIYSFDFFSELSSEQRKHVLGAEAAMWGEQTDSQVLTSKIWPRTAALAESTWSGNRDPQTGKYRTELFTQRILNFREYLVALGYAATPLVPQFCHKNPHACDLYESRED